MSRDYPGIMVRDQSFLSWRFDRCPNRDYTRYLARRNGAPVGYMVAREIRWRGTRRGRIVDYLVGRDDSAAFDALIRTVMSDSDPERLGDLPSPPIGRTTSGRLQRLSARRAGAASLPAASHGKRSWRDQGGSSRLPTRTPITSEHESET